MDFCKRTTGKFVPQYDKWLDSGGGCEKVAEYQENETWGALKVENK